VAGSSNCGWRVMAGPGVLRLAGLVLTLPDLVALDLPALVATAGYPGTQVIPAVSCLLSLPALKLTTLRRVSHVDDLAADPGAALFAGLTTLPKARTALPAQASRTIIWRPCTGAGAAVVRRRRPAPRRGAW